MVRKNIIEGKKKSFSGKITLFFFWVFYKHIFYTVTVTFLLGVVLMVWNLNKLEKNIVQSTAIENAELYSQALTEFRTIYTSEVVKTVKEQGIEVTHDYETRKGAIPLPATLSMKLGEKIGKHQSGAETKLYSPYPFPWRGEIGKFRDTFSKDAWKALSKNPEKPFYRFEEYKGRLSLRYASADLMRNSCINCHNTHPQTPKNDWKVGDLRGILEVIHPIDVITANTENDLKQIFFTVTLLTGLSVLVLVVIIKKLRKNTSELEEAHNLLEHRVEERTEDLKKACSDLEGEVRQREIIQGELVQSEKMASIGQLAAGVAHEINNPVGFISSNLNSLNEYIGELKKILNAYDELLNVCQNQSEVKTQVQTVQQLRDESDLDYILSDLGDLIAESIEGTSRVRKIVADLQDFSHVDSPETTEENINELLDKTISVAWNELKYKAEVIKEFGDIPVIFCYGGKLGQVFLNLLVNAAQAIEEQGRITVRTGKNQDQVWIEIADTGRGIPEENLNKIFDPFFTTKEIGKGTGLGLNLVHKIIEAHGGSIDIDSIVGKGTIFRIELPLSGPPESENQQETAMSDANNNA